MVRLQCVAALDSPNFGEMLDTTPQARARYYELLRRATLAQRVSALNGASRGIKRLAEAGIRREHPQASDDEVRVRLAVRLYGRDLGRRLFGTIPEDAR